MTHLYELTGELAQLEKLDPENENMAEAIAETFNALTAEFNDKAVAIVKVAKNADADIDALDAEIKRLQARKKTIQNFQNGLREYLRSNMEASGISKIECPLFSITLRKPSKVVVIDDEEQIPVDYKEIKTVVKTDKRRLLADLKDGEDIPGAHIELSKPALIIK